MSFNVSALEEKLINYRIVNDDGERFVETIFVYLRLKNRFSDPIDVIAIGDKEVWKELIIRAIHVVGNKSLSGESYKINGAYDKIKNELYRYLELCLDPPKEKYYIS